jgi:hypothetical protein
MSLVSRNTAATTAAFDRHRAADLVHHHKRRQDERDHATNGTVDGTHVLGYLLPPGVEDEVILDLCGTRINNRFVCGSGSAPNVSCA